MDEGRIQTNRLKDKEINKDAKKMTQIDSISQIETKEKEDSLAVRGA